jgi:bacillithiol system protein YtxJ
MGFFTKRVIERKLPWIALTSIEQLNQVVKTTHEKPVLFFKHSTRCGVSSMALNSFENQWSTNDSLCDLYYLDLLQHRDVSNEIAALTGVHHQSPQVIVLKGDEIIYDASHSSIDARRIESSLKR